MRRLLTGHLSQEATHVRALIASIESEYRRYQRTGDGVLSQLDPDQLRAQPSVESNSVATLVWHIAGNLESRFTDFLTTDGEKPWRDRDDEFSVREASPDEVRAKWERGWAILLTALAELDDDSLLRPVTIRGVGVTVAEALHRSLAHTASHVGQMAYVGKLLRGPDWEYLTIPPGGSTAYNRSRTMEQVPDA